MTNRVRIHDVAAEAGVSIGTVSDALNGKGRMTEATRELVRRTADRLGYRANHTARSLRQGRSGLIGLILRGYSDVPGVAGNLSYVAELLSGTTTNALGGGYALVVIPAEQAMDGAHWLPLDAVVVADPLDDDPVLAALRARGIPLLTDWSLSGDPGVLCVDHDHAATMRTVLEHFAAQGARRMGLLTGDAPDHYTRVSVATFHAWCDEHRLPGTVERIGRTPQEPIVDAALRLLGRTDRPDAVFGLQEITGHPLLDAARRLSLGVPDDLLLVCADDITYASTDPPLTTVSFQPRRMTEVGNRLLNSALAGDWPEQPHHLVPTLLTIRASSSRSPAPALPIVIHPS